MSRQAFIRHNTIFGNAAGSAGSGMDPLLRKAFASAGVQIRIDISPPLT